MKGRKKRRGDVDGRKEGGPGRKARGEGKGKVGSVHVYAIYFSCLSTVGSLGSTSVRSCSWSGTE